MSEKLVVVVVVVGGGGGGGVGDVAAVTAAVDDDSMMSTSMMTVSKTITSTRFPCMFVSLANKRCKVEIKVACDMTSRRENTS